MNRHSHLIAIVMGIIASLCGIFGCRAQNSGFDSVNPQEFSKCIADTVGVTRLDVRTADEYAAGHINGSLNIDVLKPDFAAKAAAVLPKDKTVALYCRSGKRSKKAAALLTAEGYKVVELDSGYNGWTAAGLPTVK